DGVSDDAALSVGPTGGGTIDIFCGPVGKELFPQLGDVAAAISAGQPVGVATVIAGPGRVGARRIIGGQAAPAAAAGTLAAGERLDQAVDDDARGVLPQGLTGGRPSPHHRQPPPHPPSALPPSFPPPPPPP